MDDVNELIENSEESPAPAVPTEPVAPIQSRFLFVDVAGLRAKQLRRGARPRFTPEHPGGVHKPERMAMEEVKRGLVYYEVPQWRPHATDNES